MVSDNKFNFGIRQQKECIWLSEWFSRAKQLSLSAFERLFLTFIHNQSAASINNWKEVDIRDNFIAPLITLVNFNLPDYLLSSFSEHSLMTKLDDVILKGRVNYMVAIGQGNPHQPFFSFMNIRKKKVLIMMD